MTEEIQRCYEILELDLTTAAKDIKQAWREMAKVLPHVKTHLRLQGKISLLK